VGVLGLTLLLQRGNREKREKKGGQQKREGAGSTIRKSVPQRTTTTVGVHRTWRDGRQGQANTTTTNKDYKEFREGRGDDGFW